MRLRVSSARTERRGHPAGAGGHEHAESHTGYEEHEDRKPHAGVSEAGHAQLGDAGETLDTGVCRTAFFEDPDDHALMLHHRYEPKRA